MLERYLARGSGWPELCYPIHVPKPSDLGGPLKPGRAASLWGPGSEGQRAAVLSSGVPILTVPPAPRESSRPVGIYRRRDFERQDRESRGVIR